MKTKKIGLLFAAVAVTAAIALAGCPTAVRPPPPIDMGDVTWISAAEAVINGIDGIQGSGPATFEIGTRPGEFFGLRISNRSDDWHGLDIMFDQMPPDATSGLSVEVRGFGDATAAGSVRLTLPDGEHAQVAISILTASEFVLSTGFSERVRIGSNDAGQNSNIILTAIYVRQGGNDVWSLADAIADEGLVPPPGGGGNGGNGENGGDNGGGMGDANPVRVWGEVIASNYIGYRDATLTATAYGIQVSDRGSGVHDHNHGLTIDVAGLRILSPGDIVISGTVTPGHTMWVQGVVGNINAPAAQDGTFTITIPAGAVISVPDWLGEVPVLGTAPGPDNYTPGELDDYTVTGITVGGRNIWVVLEIDLTEDDTTNGGGNDVDDIVLWRALIDTDFIGSRGATLTATEDGIEVSGRGEEQYDHNNGIAIDIAGLRALAGGTPEIVITGTATAGITRIDVQDMDIRGSVSNSAFTLTIPFATEVRVPDWASAEPFPFLATAAAGENGNYTITGITVGGTRIFDLPGLDLDLEGEEENGDPEEYPESPWIAVIGSDFIGTRGANVRLTATADGIVVWYRGEGEHDHNNGIAIDIVGLRELVGGVPEIVITGTAAAGVARIDVQGMPDDVQGNVSAGAFTITVPYAAVVDMGAETWFGSPIPFLATAARGQNGNYTITGITVGGTSILDLDLD